jgi:hypothetical protein
MYITDGKQEDIQHYNLYFGNIYESEQTIGLPNNKYTYQKLIDYVNGTWSLLDEVG